MAEARRRILVVDDSPVMRQLLVMVATPHAAEVVEAPDGLAALKLLAQGAFDVVFLDLNMPVMDGRKLIQRVREDASQARTRICVVSTEGGDDTERSVRGLGADEFLRKPVQRHEVEAALRKFLAGR
jgi:two-component system chemotaxis response regulator CheY